VAVLFLGLGAGASVSAQEMLFGYEEEPAWEEGTVVEYADEKVFLENATLALPAKVLRPELAQKFLTAGSVVRFTEQNNTIVKLDLPEEIALTQTSDDQSLGIWVAILVVAAVVGIWRRFYLRAKN